MAMSREGQASASKLAERYGLNEQTVRKVRKRRTVEDARMGPKEVRSSVLGQTEQAMCLAFRRHTLLPQDDSPYALQESIPYLSRSALHRLFQRHGISRLPDIAGDKPKRSKFKRYPIGYLHIDIAELRTDEGKLWMFAAVDRTSKFAFAKLVPKAGKTTAAAFLREVVEAMPYRIHTVLTPFRDIAEARPCRAADSGI